MIVQLFSTCTGRIVHQLVGRWGNPSDVEVEGKHTAVTRARIGGGRSVMAEDCWQERRNGV